MITTNLVDIVPTIQPPASRPIVVAEDRRLFGVSAEVKRLEQLLSLKSYGVIGGYNMYGSDNGDWRIYAGKTRKLPASVGPRCSLRCSMQRKRITG